MLSNSLYKYLKVFAKATFADKLRHSLTQTTGYRNNSKKIIKICLWRKFVISIIFSGIFYTTIKTSNSKELPKPRYIFQKNIFF